MLFVKNNLKIILVYFVLFIAFIVGTFCDLSISKSLCVLNNGEYYTTNMFLQLTEIFGETVIYDLVSIALLSIYFSKAKPFNLSQKPSKIINVFCIVLLFALNVFATYEILSYANDHYNFLQNIHIIFQAVIYILGAVILSSFWYFLVGKIKPEIVKRLAIWSLIVIFTAIASQIVVQIAKPIFGRVRYRVLVFLQTENGYTAWYKINALSSSTNEFLKSLTLNDGFKSFPSAHTACASMCVCITYLPKYVDFLNNAKGKIWLNIITFLCIAVVGASRIVVGAHYLTDVVFSIIITLTACILSDLLVDKIFANQK